MQVGFLFNHDAAHQVAHAAPIAFQLARRHPEVDVTVLASSRELLEAVRSLAEPVGRVPCATGLLDVPPLQRALGRCLDRVVPASRYLALRSNLDVLHGFDALVVPEKTSLLLKTHFGLRGVKLIHTRHGAGDRAAGFNAKSGRFDFVLLPGRKVRDRLLAEGRIRPGQYAVTGYPKFDGLAERPRPGKRELFGNDRPTVLYNPHYAPGQSSWYRMGRAVLDFFAERRDHNLICAPHVMLFRRRVHAARDHLRLGWARRPPARYARRPNILVDAGSPACFDMTYTLAADVYLGDVSSQVYEFLIEPRPCIFLDAYGVRWRDDPSYRKWRLGPVIGEVGRLGSLIERLDDIQPQYEAVQKAAFRQTFDLARTPSAVRAADAIAGYLHAALGRPSQSLAAAGAAPPAAAAV